MPSLGVAEALGTTVKGGGLELSPIPIDQMSSPFDLQMLVTECYRPMGNSGRNGLMLDCAFQYNTDLFSLETIVRMEGHFVTLLKSCMDSPNKPVSELGLLTPTEEDVMLRQWNCTAQPFPHGVCAHELFERAVARNPFATAISEAGCTISYGELNARANVLARKLREWEVSPDVRVGVLMTRGMEMVTAMLAVTKAGGAYVPIDPHYPAARVQFMSDDAQMAVLLTLSALHASVPPSCEASGVKVVFVDESPSVFLPPVGSEIDSVANLEVLNTPDSLAYVVYTSGSTGRPKGVMVRQEGLVNALTWHQRVYKVTSKDRASQVIGPAFDPVGLEVWPFLTAGASLHIVDENTRVDASKLLQWLSTQRITYVPTFIKSVSNKNHTPTHIITHETVYVCCRPLWPK